MMRKYARILTIFAVCSFTLAFCRPARAGNIALPPEALHAMDRMYSGDPDSAMTIARDLEKSQSEHPLGYLLEAEAQWWKMYCAACEIKWGMVDAWKRGKASGDDDYLALADKVIQLAQAQLAKSDTAEMHTYAGIGYGLKTRLYGLRGEHRAVAKAGVSSRAEFLLALKLDPDDADATAGVGLYNFYVDTLSPIVKVLRFFMGIPGGNKEEGIRQIQKGADHGVLMAVDSRYYLAKDLRTYDLKYEQALSVAEPLAAHYPRNPVFLLLLGNLNMELGRNDKAREYFRSVLANSEEDSVCQKKMHELAEAFSAALK